MKKARAARASLKLEQKVARSKNIQEEVTLETKRVINLQPIFVPPTPGPGEKHGFDLLSIGWLRRILLWRHTRKVFQISLLIAAIAVIFDGLTGDQYAPKNLATTSTWIDYRFVLVLSILLVGNLFCMSCPFVLVSHSLQKKIGLNRAWPTWLKGKWIASGLLLVILYAYEQFSLWNNPFLTAVVTLAYFGGAIVVDGLFKGNAFCKYVCPLGMFNQVYAMVSPTEVKSKSFAYCKSCTTKECVKGNEHSGKNGVNHQEGCQTQLYIGTKQSNLDCTYALSCVKACPYSNVALETRPFGRELWVNIKKREFSLGVAVMVVTFGALTNAGGMVNGFTDVEAAIARALGLNEFWAYTLIFLLLTTVIPAGVALLASQLSLRMSRSHDYDWRGVFKRFAPGLLPLSLGIWTAHYFFHFVVGGGGGWPTLQNLFKRIGFPILGEPNWATGALLPYGFILPIQLLFIYGGFLLTSVSMYQISRQMFVRKRKTAQRAMIAWVGLALLLALVAMYIMFQPMQARGTFST